MTKNAFLIIIAVFSIFFPITTAHAQNMNLVQNGQPAAQIVIGHSASPTERYAAQELQRALKLISGAELKIAEGVVPNTPAIVIGTPQSTPGIKAANLFNTKNDEEVRVVRRDGVLYLAGATPRAALYATYTFLQDTLGARWFWPGASGEFLPRRESIAVGALNIRQTPSLVERSLSINSPHYDEDTVAWMGRNRMNWHHVQGRIIPEHVANMHENGLQVLVGGHNATLPPELLEAHPEYMAEYGGKRQIPAGHPPHLCWANPGVQEAMAQKIAQWWTENPDIDSVSFFGADHTHFCECAQCAAFGPDVSTRWQKFSKIVIDRVNKTHPGKDYQTLAYQAYRDVPTEVAPFDVIGYCTYNINYTKPLTDQSNAKARAEMQAWQKLGARMGIRGYQFIPFNQAMFAPITSLIVEEVAWTHQNGLVGWKSEVTPFGHPKKPATAPEDENWTTNRMALYAAAQAMWNAQVKPDAIMQDWSQQVFGPAAQPMLEYYQAMDNAWRTNKQQLTYFLQPPASFVDSFITTELLQKADVDFQRARTALNSVTDEATKLRAMEQINLEAAMLDNWRELYQLQQGRAGHLQAYAPRAVLKPLLTAQAADPAWKNAGSLPAFETSNGKAIDEQTEVQMLWDEEALYLRFINHDADIKQLKALRAGHDENIFGDDVIELFLDDPSTPAAYFHLAANASGARYDAKADGAMNFEKAWNPQWMAKTSVQDESWILDVKLPLASFGIKAGEQTQWKMSFKRSGASRRDNSGWPDASYHNPAGFGTVTLVEKVPQQKRVVIFDAGGKSNGLRAELARHGFTASAIEKDPAELERAVSNDADAVVLHAAGEGFVLPAEFIAEKLQPFLRNGGLVLISSYGQRPLEKWFGDEAAVKWSGWEISTNRVTAKHDNGDWQRKPHSLEKVIATGVTPSSGFTPLSDKWEVLASLTMKNGDVTPYLLRAKIGKGTLILTGSNFGYGGGHEMFGSMNPAYAAMLLDNLLAAHRNQ